MAGQKETAVAITDHGFMGNALEFFRVAEAHNKKVAEGNVPSEIACCVKPIIGMEAYIVNDRTVKVKGETNRHLLMLARNEEGFKNLLRLHHEGYKTGATFVYDRIVPRLDRTLLKRSACKGIIATTGCIVSEIAADLVKLSNVGDDWKEDWNKARQTVEFYRSVFDELYAEVHPDHFLIGQDPATYNPNTSLQIDYNEKIKHLAREMNLPLTVATDAHYLNRDDREAHQLILAIQSKKDITDPDRFCFEATPMISGEEMMEELANQGFKNRDEIVANTVKIADSCEYPKYLEFGGYRIPKFPIPDNPEYREFEQGFKDQEASDTKKYTMFLIEKNWNKKIKTSSPKKQDEYRERLKTEADVIDRMGFFDYFLIVQDLIQWCRDNDILVGAGRGSAGGCLLSYLLGITKLDPLKFDLLFSRFLNPDRISMPDIDVDIDKKRRDEVKAYLAEKYGEKRVASIATFSRMKVRACIKDIIRSMQLGGSKQEAFRLADSINKTIEDLSDDVSYDEAINPEHGSAAFKNYMDQYPDVAKYAQEFEGLIRQTGIHAAGVIVGDMDLDETIPLIVDKNSVVATAYDGATLEANGFLKIDLLGLKNLTIISDTIKNIKKVRDEDFRGFHSKGVPVSYDEDPDVFERKVAAASPGVRKASKAYQLLREERTNGVFQVECLSGDTVIGHKGTIKELYERQEKGDFTNFNNKTSSVYLDDGKIRRNQILKVLKSGKKKTFRLVTDDNRFIRASARHQFLTPDGWKELQELRTGDQVLVKQIGYMRVCEKCDTEMQQWIKSRDWTKQTRCKRCGCLETKNSTKPSARRKNSEWHRGHTPWDKGLTKETFFATVRDIQEFGEEETYDLCMKAPGHNYIANGFVVHNSQMMKSLLRGVNVNDIEDIGAVLALCRPGPLKEGMTSAYGERKRSGEDREEWYIHPATRKVLQKTYGIIVYQEQCMQLAVHCAGFSEADADGLRKAIGKKIKELMEEYREKFVAGCQEVSGMTEDTAAQLWKAVEVFSGYGFNKCLSYDTEITTRDGRTFQIGDLAGTDTSDLKLMSVNAHRELVPNQLVEVFSTGRNELFEVEFDDGRTVKCTLQHKFLCEDGQFHTIQEILDNDLEVVRRDIFYAKEHAINGRKIAVEGYLNTHGKVTIDLSDIRGVADKEVQEIQDKVYKKYVEKRVKVYEYRGYVYVVNQHGCAKKKIEGDDDWSNADAFYEKIQAFGEPKPPLTVLTKYGISASALAELHISSRPSQQTINNAARQINSGQITNIPHGSSIKEVEEIRRMMK